MGTTTKGYPYPEPTDPVAQGADVIKALAEMIDAAAGSSAAGTVAATIPRGAAQSAAVTVTFPAGRFTAPPAIAVAMVYGASVSYIASAAVAGNGAVSVRAGTRNGSNVGADVPVVIHWIARSIG